MIAHWIQVCAGAAGISKGANVVAVLDPKFLGTIGRGRMLKRDRRISDLSVAMVLLPAIDLS